MAAAPAVGAAAAARHPVPVSWAAAGRPLASATLQAARNGAWLSLAGSVHWKMLADLPGVADTTASAWHKENGGDRASYVASRLRHGHTHADPA